MLRKKTPEMAKNRRVSKPQETLPASRKFKRTLSFKRLGPDAKRASPFSTSKLLKSQFKGDFIAFEGRVRKAIGVRSGTALHFSSQDKKVNKSPHSFKLIESDDPSRGRKWFVGVGNLKPIPFEMNLPTAASCGVSIINWNLNLP